MLLPSIMLPCWAGWRHSRENVTPWLLPKEDNETRGKLRPDILIIEGLGSRIVPQENQTKYTKFINKILKKQRNSYQTSPSSNRKRRNKNILQKKLATGVKGGIWRKYSCSTHSACLLGVGGAMFKYTRVCQQTLEFHSMVTEWYKPVSTLLIRCASGGSSSQSLIYT